MKLEEVLSYLESKGSAQTKKVLRRHGAREPFFGVKVADLKLLQKKIKIDHELAIELYATGNSDAMYLAAMVADHSKFSKNDLQTWAKKAYWYLISDYALAYAAAKSRFGFELSEEWIHANDEFVQSAGWSTLASLISTTSNEELSISTIKEKLEYIEKNLHASKNRVRYAMNNFVLSSGIYIPELTEQCKRIGANLGAIKVDMGETSCKVPKITEYIAKVELKNKIGIKRKLNL